MIKRYDIDHEPYGEGWDVVESVSGDLVFHDEHDAIVNELTLSRDLYQALAEQYKAERDSLSELLLKRDDTRERNGWNDAIDAAFTAVDLWLDDADDERDAFQLFATLRR